MRETEEYLAKRTELCENIIADIGGGSASPSLFDDMNEEFPHFSSEMQRLETESQALEITDDMSPQLITHYNNNS